jgi:hypothetical protein
LNEQAIRFYRREGGGYPGQGAVCYDVRLAIGAQNSSAHIHDGKDWMIITEPNDSWETAGRMKYELPKGPYHWQGEV